MVTSPPLRLKWRDPAELEENPANWRRHPKAQLAALQDVLAEVGWAGALLYNEATGRLIDGHARKKLAPNGKVPVLVGSWTEEQERKILATLDPIGEMAVAHEAQVEALLATVRSDSDAIQALLDSVREQAGISLPQEPLLDPEPQIDRAAELQAKWGTAPGQDWQIDPHRLVCGDCREKAVVGRLWRDGGPKIRLVWTDPPYGVNLASKNERLNRTDRGGRVQRPIVGDDMEPDEVGALFCDALRATEGRTEPGAVVYAMVPPRQDAARFHRVPGARWLDLQGLFDLGKESVRYRGR